MSQNSKKQSQKDKQKNKMQQGKIKQKKKSVKNGNGKKKNRVLDKNSKVLVEVPSQVVQTSIPVIAVVDNEAMSATVFPVANWLLNHGFLGQMNQNPDGGLTPAEILLGALNYMLFAIQNSAQGVTQVATVVPKFLNVLLEAVKPKTQTFKEGVVSYSWNENTVFSLNPQSNGSALHAAFVMGDPLGTNAYDSPITTCAPQAASQDSYNKILKFFSLRETAMTACVATGTKEISTKDCAAFARQYVYNGIGFTKTGGWYTNLENEVPVRVNLFSKLVDYGNVDIRVGRYFSGNSGDSLSVMGIPLLPEFKYQQYKNQYTDIYKAIDILEVVTYLAIWAKAVKDRYSGTIDVVAASNNPTMANTLPFTAQDFTILVRQMLMSTFNTQMIGQFLEPRKFVAGNGFVPLVGHCGSYGNAYFQEMQIPELLKENLGALHYREYVPETPFANSRNVYRLIPVLGSYITDTLVDLTFTAQDSTQIPLFNPAPQTFIRLSDGFDGTNFVDLNGAYYQDMLAEWNFLVEQSQQYTTAMVSAGSDCGPKGLPCIAFTRYYSSLTNIVNKKVTSRESNLYRGIVNMPGSSNLIKKVSQKSIKGAETSTILSLPAATFATLTTTTLTMIGPVGDELLGLLKFMILPSARIDPDLPDPISVEMLQISSVESCVRNLSNLTNFNVVSGLAVLGELVQQANLNVTGTAAGKTGVYADLMGVLRNEGKGSGLFSSLAGMVLKATPLAPLAGLAELIPF
jgi:hypothetical protein